MQAFTNCTFPTIIKQATNHIFSKTSCKQKQITSSQKHHAQIEIYQSHVISTIKVDCNIYPTFYVSSFSLPPHSSCSFFYLILLSPLLAAVSSSSSSSSCDQNSILSSLYKQDELPPRIILLAGCTCKCIIAFFETHQSHWLVSSGIFSFNSKENTEFQLSKSPKWVVSF